MTLLFFDGLQDAGLVPKPEWSTGIAWSPQTGRRSDTSGAATINSQTNKTVTVSASTCIVGLGVKVAAPTSIYGTRTSFAKGMLEFSSGAAAIQLCIAFDATGRLIVYRGTLSSGTTIATSTLPMAPDNTWCHVQAKVVLDGTSGVCEVRVNGASVITFSGNTLASGSAGPVTSVGVGNPSNNGIYFDDIWMCDGVDATSTQGRTNNDFLGDLAVLALMPTAAGASTGWAPSTGANWTTVDEVPASTTDYVSTLSSVVGTRDTYEVADLASTVTAVYGVQVGLYAAKTDAGTANVKTVIRESTGTVTTSSSKPLTTPTAGGVWGEAMYRKSGGTLWSTTDVNGVQVGMETS